MFDKVGSIINTLVNAILGLNGRMSRLESRMDYLEKYSGTSREPSIDKGYERN